MGSTRPDVIDDSIRIASSSRSASPDSFPRLMAAEPPIIIENRKTLTYLLCEAAELEHGLMCEYLYAAFSLKTEPDETLPSRTPRGGGTLALGASSAWPPRRCCTGRWSTTC